MKKDRERETKTEGAVRTEATSTLPRSKAATASCSNTIHSNPRENNREDSDMDQIQIQSILRPNRRERRNHTVAPRQMRGERMMLLMELNASDTFIGFEARFLAFAFQPERPGGRLERLE